MLIKTINPATEKIIQRYQTLPFKELDRVLNQAHLAYLNWKETSISDRAVLLKKLAKGLMENKKEYALLITREMGKPIQQADAEIEKSVWLCEHYASVGPSYLSSERIQTQLEYSEVSYQPLGVVLGIMPWNFPFWQVFRYVVPTLLAGNATLLKHAPISTGAALAIDSLFRSIDAPPFLFQSLIASNSLVTRMISDDRISAVTFTGSERVGQKIGALAGRSLKRMVLELGGNDPYLVLEDADIKLAARLLVTSRLNNAGQSCNAAKRVILHRSVSQPFIMQLQEEMSRYVMGDPECFETTLGPLAREDLRQSLHHNILKTVDMGAKILSGAMLPSQRGFYYPPTLIRGVKPGMPAFEEELFGPVLSVIEVSSLEEAIELANQSRFGLGGGVFTQDIEKGVHIARYRIQSGSCFVNQCVSSDPNLPFGGIKHSGVGRELGAQGIREFVNVKTLAYMSNQ